MYRNTTICLTALLLAGCVTKEIQVVTNPINPTITVKGDQTAEVIRNSSGALIKLPSSKNNYIVEVRADGYETETRAIDPGTADPKVPITIDLEKIKDIRKFRFTSDPDGAYVAIDGTVLYKTTPVTAEVTFERPSKAAKWLPKEVTYSKDNWETQTVSLKIGDNENPPTAELKRLNHTIPVKIAATSSDGAPLPAAVTIDGKESGTTPITVPIPFSRSKGTDP
ncbi:MAG TPA: hypothetical protein VK995_00745, partial [Oceanipulchritudo sp.]|nr:hypothetical protein [Oceanipulchritudo sp.]